MQFKATQIWDNDFLEKDLNRPCLLTIALEKNIF